MPAKALALGLPQEAWQTVTWREGSANWLTSRFARARVRAAHRDEALAERRGEEWLLIEWPPDEKEPTKLLVRQPSRRHLVRAAGRSDQPPDQVRGRWRIERDYQELKQELGLGHYEGRGWRGFHHHATMCIAAYGFLISERETIPPSGPGAAAMLQKPAVPDGYRPRGAADPARAAYPKLNRDDATPPHCRPCQKPRPSPCCNAPRKPSDPYPHL
jgi:hypothetical protein